MNRKIISELKYGSTWKLIGLGFITYGVYFAYYIKTKTAVINEQCERSDRIPDSLVNFIMIINYLSLALFFPYIFVEETHPVAALSSLVDLICGITFIVWGFKARNRMNIILAAQQTGNDWFHGLWTFFLTPLYFNFKINKLNELVESERGSDD